MIYKVRRQIKVNNHTINEIYKTAGFIRVYRKDNGKDKKDKKVSMTQRFRVLKYHKKYHKSSQ